MKSSIVTKFLAVAAAVLCVYAGPASAQDGGELSEKTVNVITGFALTTIPSEIKRPDGSVMKIDKSDLSKIVVPVDDARRVIKVARLSAHAQMCDLPQLQAQNYLTMMRQERAKDKWTEEQLLFINRLHLFTVMWLSGNVRFVDKGDGSKEPEIISDPDESKNECTEEDRKQVRAAIENYLKQAKKS
ncbi:hypothetical protein [Dichotomicrobium thermohalophilum]|nr:hypothetical protein [Dichotomicrobium thermohalophilum]